MTRAWVVAIAVMGFGAVVAAAEETCATCGDEPQFGAASTMLETHGFKSDAFSILFTWKERTASADQPFVVGFRLQDRATNRAFDLYVDMDGNVVNEDALKRLGVEAKNWRARPIETFAHRATVVPSAVKPVRKAANPGVVRRVAEIDWAAVEAEDMEREATQGKGVARIGVLQDVGGAITVSGSVINTGTWQPAASGGFTWSVIIQADAALGQRIHFQSLEIPEGGQIVVYNTGDPSEIYGPYTGVDAFTGDRWSATCWAEAVTIECFAPSEAARDATQIVIDQIAYMYRPLDEVQWGTKDAGACNNDVSCFPAWVDTSLGVGGQSFISQPDGALFCTGSLLADTDNSTEIPYFLTANHCVGSQAQASSVEVYWFYQTTVCEVPPNPPNPANPAEVPRTEGGAQLLATTTEGSGTDFCLLQLNNPPAAGVTYLGWSPDPAAVGTDATVIHHPSGDFKRISFGDITNDVGEPLRGSHPISRYHQVTWNDGTTEPGSSGSPLMLTATAQVIGQLWGGFASCSNPAPDYFGRFDVSFPLIESFLDPLMEINFESAALEVNETVGTATLTVNLTNPPGIGNTVTVDYASQNGSAIAGLDYTAVSGTLEFMDAETTQTINIPILNDTHHEPTESFTVVLSNPSGAQLPGPQLVATVTIIDDDVDTDLDGISDQDELSGFFGFVSDPNLQDTDGDGVNDNIELFFGTDPGDPNDTPSLSTMPMPFFADSK